MDSSSNFMSFAIKNFLFEAFLNPSVAALLSQKEEKAKVLRKH